MNMELEAYLNPDARLAEEEEEEEEEAAAAQGEEEARAVNFLGAATEMANGRTCKETKYQYGRKQLHLKQWVIAELGGRCYSVESEKVILADLSANDLLQFLGYTMFKRHKDGTQLAPPVYNSFQHVSGYKSAIKAQFRAESVPVPAVMEEKLGDFFAGYKRHIASLKQKGEMKLQEGI
jgi:hypothetical protein